MQAGWNIPACFFCVLFRARAADWVCHYRNRTKLTTLNISLYQPVEKYTMHTRAAACPPQQLQISLAAGVSLYQPPKITTQQSAYDLIRKQFWREIHMETVKLGSLYFNGSLRCNV